MGWRPGARRIITPVKSASVGLVHDRVTESVVVSVTESPVTGPGAVVSGGGGGVLVVAVAVAAVAWLGMASWANRA